MKPGVSGGAEGESANMRAALRACRAESREIAARLSAEDCQAQSMADASPIKWHLAHTTWFFATFVLEPLGLAPFALVPSYRSIFNSYYRGVGAAFARYARGQLVRPTLAEVLAWRARVEGALFELSEQQWRRMAPVVLLGLAHEQQHQELMLTDVKHLLWSTGEVFDADLGSEDVWGRGGPPRGAEPAGWTSFDAGLRTLGHRGAGFAYDNEQPAHRVWLEPFEMRDTCVSYREVIAFIEAGGYRDASLWLDAGFAWVERERVEHPLYFRSGSPSEIFTLAGYKPLCGERLDEPCVHLSFYEADAIARFLGASMPSEEQWETWRSEDARARDLHQAWEWTGSAYRPYPGFRPAAGAIGEYNGKFMDGCYVLRGASSFTPRGHERATYRNFFHPTARWQRAGVRLCREVAARSTE